MHVRCFVLLTGSGTALFGFISGLHGVAPTDGENERDCFWLFSVLTIRCVNLWCMCVCRAGCINLIKASHMVCFWLLGIFFN